MTWISHGVTCIPHPKPPPTSLSTRPLWVFPVHQARALVSCIQPGLVICFTLDNIHVLMLFSQYFSSIDIQIPKVDLISPVLTLKTKRSIINKNWHKMVSWQKMVQNRNYIHLSIGFCFAWTACEENNTVFACFKISSLNVINECPTLLVLSSEAMFAYTAFCIFLGKVHRPAWRHSLPFSRGHSPKDPDTWPDDTRGPRWRCVLLFYHLVWYTWKITQILGFKLCPLQTYLSMFYKVSHIIIS